MPERIQRKRAKGWRMPEGAIYVGRPTCWGNPFQIGGPEDFTAHMAVRLYRNAANGIWDPGLLDVLSDQAYCRNRDSWEAWRKRIGGHPTEAIRHHLRGHNLVCWCPLDQPCHGDVLLEVANS